MMVRPALRIDGERATAQTCVRPWRSVTSSRRFAIRRCREAEQVGSRDRRADGLAPAAALGGDKNSAFAVEEQDILLGEQPLVVKFREFAQVERGEQHEFQRARIRSHWIGDLEHRYSGQAAEYRLHRDGPCETFACLK